MAGALVAEYLDASAQFDTQYNYMVMAIDGETRKSVVSETATITPKDTFPPAVPTGVTAAASNNAIELAWVRNTEADFRGYNLYRAEGAGDFHMIASLLEAPVFSDAKIEAGKMCRYEISAVDLLGNGSARSEPVTIPSLIGRHFPIAKIENESGTICPQTRERYLGSRQNLKEAVNDRLGLD